jgi:hypothetical protein
MTCNTDEDTCGPRWTCDDDADCTGNTEANAAGAVQCVDIPDDTDELCVARAVGAHCESSSDCPGDSYCCEPCGRICISATNGATCTQDSDCTRGGRSGLCSIANPATGGVGGGPGVCSSGLSPGSPCVNRGGLHGCPTGYDCVRNVYRCVEQPSTGPSGSEGGGV